MIKRRVEIVAFERRRVIRQPVAIACPVCLSDTVMLTTRQAGALAQVGTQSVRRWLAAGRAHGVKTAGGQHRICRNSLFVVPSLAAHCLEPEGRQ
jgi:hypothetical protein